MHECNAQNAVDIRALHSCISAFVRSCILKQPV
jgi:hypothetical protein